MNAKRYKMNCEDLDKRTKAYKECVEQSLQFGLGDTVEEVTEATGIKKLVKFIAGEDCGCDERKDKLNKLFPRKVRAPKCLNEEQYNELSELIARYPNNRITQIKSDDVQIIYRLHADIFHHKYLPHQTPCTCNSSLWREWTNDLLKMHGEYNN